MANYQFLDANGSILTAASSTMGGVNYPIVISSIVGGLSVTQSGSWTTSVVGGVSVLGGSLNVASLIGTMTPYAQSDSFTSGVTSTMTLTTASSVLNAPGASLRNYITHITFTNAATVGTFVDIKDTGGNVLYSGYAAASGGGVTASFPVPIKQPTTARSIDAVARTQASVIVAISGYIAP